jgi:hypothetical protein
VVSDIFIDNDTLLVTDFVNLKIKSTQFFGGAHKYKIIHLASNPRFNIGVVFITNYSFSER